jgi:hypothetical protein
MAAPPIRIRASQLLTARVHGMSEGTIPEARTAMAVPRKCRLDDSAELRIAVEAQGMF